MNVHIRVVPHNQQRYDTCGDWYYAERQNVLNIVVSELPDANYEQLVAMHEYIEATLCAEAGIDPVEVDAFDLMFEHEGKDGEPGDDPRAPYYRQHQIATAIEKLLAVELGVNWQEYEKALNALVWRGGKKEVT